MVRPTVNQVQIMSSGTGKTLYTIGYGKHSVEELAYILHAYKIGALIDVRSQPSDSATPDFNQAALQKTLPTFDLDYTYMGKELGVPDDPKFKLPNGQSDYDKIERTPTYQFGIAQLSRLIARFPEGAPSRPNVAIFSAVADPARSHRELLIARTLRDADWTIRHILPDGTLG